MTIEDETGAVTDAVDAHANTSPRPAQNAVTGEMIAAWLLSEGVQLTTSALMDGLAWRLRAAGLPIDRFSCSMQLLSASVLAASILWRPHWPMEFRTFDFAERDSGLYERSPFKVAHDTGTWFELDLAKTPDDAFGIVPELKEAGIAHYVVIPMHFSDGSRNTVTVATASAAGFSEANRALLTTVMPAITVVLEIKTQARSFREVLATYVGTGPAQRIVAGTTHRGEVTSLRAAIYVADLRGFTWLSTQMPPTATADALNHYYDIVVPPIRDEGGDVLKFIGDAVLAIFPVDEADPGAAAAKALKAADAALAASDACFTVAGVEHPIRFGIALHVGDVVYGNVGSGDRLDFTVVGRDVNVAARISSLCSTLGRPFLVSREFAEDPGAAGRKFRSLGSHPVRGLSEDLEVLAPAPGERGHEPPRPDGISVGPVLL